MVTGAVVVRVWEPAGEPVRQLHRQSGARCSGCDPFSRGNSHAAPLCLSSVGAVPVIRCRLRRCVAAVYDCASLPLLPLHWETPGAEGGGEDGQGGFVCRAEYKVCSLSGGLGKGRLGAVKFDAAVCSWGSSRCTALCDDKGFS